MPDDDAAIAPIQFRLDVGADAVTTDNGLHLEGRGYKICDAQTGAPLDEDDFFFRIGGGFVTELAGAEQCLDALQDPAFRPGKTLSLRRIEPANHDVPPVYEVYDAQGRLKVGELPVDVADAIAIYEGDSYRAAFCLWEWRGSSGRRVGLRLLLAPGWTVEELPA